jgi:excisionase family DNA binding protein
MTIEQTSEPRWLTQVRGLAEAHKNTKKRRKPTKRRRSPQPPDHPAIPAIAYSLDQAAAMLNVGRATLYREIKAGNLIARKHGKLSRVLHSDLVAFAENMPALAVK